ncbi:MAG: hypothetical protein DCF25_19825 [Leptolyngbya foveolarum]|uniref:HEPN domain-containing protein n=1 Tax=Leptolyngbya foveolarum TaxID=47253 RepID=A0A2W4TPW8_9CYAN|nr:MAG: hypothetical protein DCF25_19825 [Leptolyngbya foveolarum]
MSDLFQAKILLQVAERDLAMLSGMLNAGVFAEESFGFFVQQAAEKLLMVSSHSNFIAES